jgi:cellulose synthase operon protein YhjQ
MRIFASFPFLRSWSEAAFVTPEDEKQSGAGTPEALAKDVARLYSFAQVEEGSYHVFSRPARTHSAQPPLAEISEMPVQAAESGSAPAVPDVAAAPAAGTQPTAPRVDAAPVSSGPGFSVAITSGSTQSGPISSGPIPAAGRAAELPANWQPGHGTAIAIVSIAGGVGKTTIAANVGRILSAHGEHVLLVDATGSGLLPFYFGAEDLRCGLRTFLSPEPESQPMRVLGAERVTEDWLENEVKAAMGTAQRTIFDLGPASYSLLSQILPFCAVILVPLVVDLNSIMSIPRAEAHNRAMREERGLAVPLPVYLSNKFDAASEREREGRELIARQVGDRLLPFTIRRSPAVTDAISQRMTVADYAPGSEVVEDLRQLARWLKQAAPVAHPSRTAGRWSEA